MSPAATPEPFPRMLFVRDRSSPRIFVKTMPVCLAESWTNPVLPTPGKVSSANLNPFPRCHSRALPPKGRSTEIATHHTTLNLRLLAFAGAATMSTLYGQRGNQGEPKSRRIRTVDLGLDRQ